MASGPLANSQFIHNISAIDGRKSFAGANLGTINYSSSDSNSYLNHPTCIPDNRVDLLRQIHHWADGEDSRSIFWLSGLAGTDKSIVARTVCAEYSKSALGASFFSRGGGDFSHAGKFVASVAVQLVYRVTGLKRTICDIVAEHGDIASQSLREQWRYLIHGPRLKLAGNRHRLSQYVLVVDALDECEDKNNVRTILQLLAESWSQVKVRPT